MKAAEAAAKKAKNQSGNKYGVKTGAPPKRIEQSDDFIPFRDSVLTWILVCVEGGGLTLVFFHPLCIVVAFKSDVLFMCVLHDDDV
jgi:hypothetical protein